MLGSSPEGDDGVLADAAAVSDGAAAPTPATKVCSKCEKLKPLEDFPLRFDKSRKPGSRLAHCGDCKRAYYRKYRKSRAGQDHSAYYLQWKYGLSKFDYVALSDAQGGVCGICGGTCTVRDRLSVDHCHGTNEIRGLLCNHCNVGLGAFRDSPEALRAAADYLDQHSRHAE